MEKCSAAHGRQEHILLSCCVLVSSTSWRFHWMQTQWNCLITRVAKKQLSCAGGAPPSLSTCRITVLEFLTKRMVEPPKSTSCLARNLQPLPLQCLATRIGRVLPVPSLMSRELCPRHGLLRISGWVLFYFIFSGGPLLSGAHVRVTIL